MEKYDFPQIKSLIINELNTYLSRYDAKSKVFLKNKNNLPLSILYCFY